MIVFGSFGLSFWTVFIIGVLVLCFHWFFLLFLSFCFIFVLFSVSSFISFLLLFPFLLATFYLLFKNKNVCLFVCLFSYTVSYFIDKSAWKCYKVDVYKKKETVFSQRHLEKHDIKYVVLFVLLLFCLEIFLLYLLLIAYSFNLWFVSSLIWNENWGVN